MAQPGQTAVSSTAQEFISNVFFGGNPRKGVSLKPLHVDAETFIRMMEERAFKCGWNSDDPSNSGNSTKQVQHAAAFLTDEASTWFYDILPFTYGDTYGEHNQKMTWSQFKELFCKKWRVATKESDCHAELHALHTQDPRDTPEQYAAKVVKVLGKMFKTLPQNPETPALEHEAILKGHLEKVSSDVQAANQRNEQKFWLDGVRYGKDLARKMFVRSSITYGVSSQELRKQLIRLRAEEMTMAAFLDKLQDLVIEIEETARQSGQNANGNAPRNGGNQKKPQVHEVQAPTSTPSATMSEADINAQIEALRSMKKNAYPNSVRPSTAPNNNRGGAARGRARGGRGGNFGSRPAPPRRERDPNARCDICQTTGSHWTKDCFYKNQGNQGSQVSAKEAGPAQVNQSAVQAAQQEARSVQYSANEALAAVSMQKPSLNW